MLPMSLGHAFESLTHEGGCYATAGGTQNLYLPTQGVLFRRDQHLDSLIEVQALIYICMPYFEVGESQKSYR
jgi:hypothetical protein